MRWIGFASAQPLPLAVLPPPAAWPAMSPLASPATHCLNPRFRHARDARSNDPEGKQQQRNEATKQESMRG